MKKNFDYLSFIKNLLSFSPRQLEGEKKAADFLISFLRKNNFPYYIDYFWTKVPKVEKEILKADNKKIPCKGCSFVTGKIVDKEYLISSLIPSRFFLENQNINFNPKCDEISLSNFYFAPSLAISKNNLALILKAKKIKGEIIVRPIRYKARNILVGNVKNPKTIYFAHYDSIQRGAIDNASGVATLMGIIFSYPEIIKNNLFVFAANEELSYDKPTYWGHGFRAFEDKFFKIMKLAKEILVIDSLGNGKMRILNDKNLIYLAFPIKNKEKLGNKIKVVSGDLDKLMTVYHSELDDIKEIKINYLKEAVDTILNKFL
jgi:hypothetical protein